MTVTEEDDLHIPFRYNFTGDRIRRLASEHPAQRAMIWLGEDGSPKEQSFSTLWEAVARAAAVLTAHGVRRGDTVLVLLSREREWWNVMLACLQIGAIAVPATTQLTSKDIEYRCTAAKIRCIAASGAMAAKVEETAGSLGEVAKLHIGGARDGWSDYDGLVFAITPFWEVADTSSDDDAIYYFTSGTTGVPKMTVHGHGYALAHRITGTHWLGLGHTDLHWNLSDTGWAKAAWSSLFGPWQLGAGIFVHHVPGFDATKALENLERFPITTLCAPPTAYRLFVRAGLENRKFRCLRHCVSAGEPLNPEVMDVWRSATGLEIYDGYGQTETIILCANRPGAMRRGAMGRAVPGMKLAVINNAGAVLSPGEEGDVALRVGESRPPGLFKCYKDDPVRTASVFREGWYLTGDRAYADRDGFFWFVGRADDVIISAGYRIGPFEVESALIEHPAVVESAVVASPDLTRGEVVKAFVILAPGYRPSEALVRELQSHVKGVTAPYKYPRKIEFVASLPKTISGKILRRLLRDKEWANGKHP